SYIRRERPDLTLLDTQVNLDTEDLTYEAAIALMTRYRNLRGIYCCGGGRNGVIRAVIDEGRVGQVDVIANELTDTTRRALSDGVVSMVIDTPVREICETMFGLGLQAVKSGPGEAPGQVLVPLRLILPAGLWARGQGAPPSVVRHSRPATGIHLGVTLRRAVMEGAENLIQRHRAVAVIHLEEFVMQVMRIGMG